MGMHKDLLTRLIDINDQFEEIKKEAALWSNKVDELKYE